MSKKATRSKQSSVEQVAQLMADQITALSSATAVSSSSSDPPPPPPVDTASAPASSSTDPSASPATPSASVPAPSSSSTDAPTTTSTASSSSSSSGSASSLPSFSLPILLPNVSSDNKNQVTMWPPMYMFQPHLLGSLLKNGTNSDGSTMSVATLEQWQSQLAALPAQFANMAAQNNPALLALAESKNAADKKEKRSSNSSRKERVFACQQPGCNSTFNTRFSLKRHLKKHSGDRPYVCTHELGRDFGAKQCGRRFAEMSTLKRHVRTHTGERPYRCNFPGCGKSFADRTNVRRHRQTHVHSKPYSCPGDNCDRTFVRKGFLAKHIASRHKYMSTPLGLLSGNASGSGSEETEDDSVDGDDMDHDDEVTNDTPVVATSAPASISSLAGSSTSVPIVLPPLPASIAAVVSSSVAAATSAAASASSASTTSDS